MKLKSGFVKKEIIIIIASLTTLLIIFMGATYAYFTSSSNVKSISSVVAVGGKMIIAYNDGSDEIKPVTNIIPSNAILVDKTFTLTGTNTTKDLTMPYKVGLKYTSTFSDGQIHYYIKEINRVANSSVTADYVIKPETGKTKDDYINQTVPGNAGKTGYVHQTLKKGTDVYTEMVTGEFPASTDNQTITFNLIMQFPDTNENQDIEKGKEITGKIIINNDNYKATQIISDLYEATEKDENGITLDGLQKDGTGAYNIQTVSTNTNKYNIKLLENVQTDVKADAYDNLRYVGANPNNYLLFNNEMWRIMGVFNNITTIDEQGNEKKETLIKIIRRDSLGNYSWDSSETSTNYGWGVNEWTESDLMYELNCDGSGNTSYCRDDISNGYLSNKTEGNTNWYNDSNNALNGEYNYSNNMKSTSMDKIATVRWNLGGYSKFEVTTLEMYSYERGTNVISGRSTTWDGKIGLMYPSDYGYASTDENCRKSLNSCDTEENKSNNWLYTNAQQWQLSPHSEAAFGVFNVGTNGRVGYYMASGAYEVRPVLFLKSDAVIKSGTGKLNDPFVLK